MDTTTIALISLAVAILILFFGNNIIIRIISYRASKNSISKKGASMQDASKLLEDAVSLVKEADNLVPATILTTSQEIQIVQERLQQAKEAVSKVSDMVVVPQELRLKLQSMTRPTTTSPSSHFDTAFTSCHTLSAYVQEGNRTTNSARELTMLRNYISEIRSKLQSILTSMNGGNPSS